MPAILDSNATPEPAIRDTESSPQPPKLLDQVRAAIRVRHYSLRTEQSYVHWVRRFIFFHGKRHPRDMGKVEVEAFLSALATERDVAAATQDQALSALLFLYKAVLGIELPWLDSITRAKKPKRLPVVLAQGEVQRLLAQVEGTHGLIIRLLYGAGLRLLEGLRLRVKDVDLESGQITVRSGKGDKDRASHPCVSSWTHQRVLVGPRRVWCQVRMGRRWLGVPRMGPAHPLDAHPATSEGVTMNNLCQEGMFACAFELVFGVGLAVIALLFIAGLLGFLDKD